MFGMSKRAPAAAQRAPKPEFEARPPLVAVSIELTPRQRDKLALLGGAAWLRDSIEKAGIPTK